MARVVKIQTNFTAGEITPKLKARVDLAKYNNSVATLENFLVSKFGAASRRPGTYYLGEIKDMTKTSRLLAFDYTSSTSYILEFNDNSIRFITSHGFINQARTLSNTTFTSGITGWTTTSTGSGTTVSHDAINGRMTLNAGGSGGTAQATASLDRAGIAQYTVTVDVYTGSVGYRVGTTSGGNEITSGTLASGLAKTFTFTPTTNGTVYISFSNTTNANHQIDNIVLTTPVYEIDSPYAYTDLDEIQFAQSYDVLYIVHPDYPPRKLIRYANDDWDLAVVEFDEPPYLDENGTSTTLTPSAVTGSITVTASSSLFSSTDVGRAIRYRSGPDETNTTTYTGTGTQTYFDIPFYPNSASDIEVYLVAANGSKTLQTNPANYTVSGGQVIMGTAPTTAQRLVIKEKNAGSGEWGWMTITAYTSATQVTATVERELAGTNASLHWHLGAWSDTTGYPRTVVFHEQRLVFAGSVTQPQTIWLSATQDFENFQPDNLLYKGSVDDTTSITVTIAEYKPQPILWLASQKILIFGTPNAVHSLNGGANGITPTSIQTKTEVNIGSSNLSPILTNNNVLFIERLGRSVRSIGYDFAIDGYRASDLSLLAPHITRDSNLAELQFQNTPSGILWGRLDDGSLISCTYLPEQEVVGWARHPMTGTDVEVESMAVIPATTHDEVYLIVKRTINGATKRYIEYLVREFDGGDKEDAFFVDCGLTYDGSAATTISGLSHLEGETVTILADGYAVPDQEVQSGQIVLDIAASKVHIGYGYSSILETNYIEGGSAYGSAQAQIARIVEVAIRVFETLGLKTGYDSTSLTTVEFRKPGDPMDTSPPLFTGDKIINSKHGFDRNYKVYVKQDQPLPATILGLIFKADVSDG